MLCSITYYLLTDNGFLILYPAVSALVCCLGAGRIEAVKEEPKKKKTALLITVAVNLVILVFLKYINFGVYTINGLAELFGHGENVLSGFSFLAPLGVSFYTFSMLSYVLDVYYGLAAPQRNFGKIALYGMYFPALISGPILSYRTCGGQFFEPHAFDYVRVTRGLQRMIWGFLKKLVIAQRLGIVVDTVYGQYTDYPGTYIWVATVCYAFQLYTDFSGCMDIVMGVSEALGLTLPENFKTPFFSKSISEYWRRWHITLGVWMKEYVFYPLLRSGVFTKLNKSFRERFGKKKGKQYATFAAMFVLWLSVGIWHGGAWKYVIGSGLLHWFYIVMEELLASPCGRMMERFHIDQESRILGGIRMLRTFFLVCIGDLFFRSESAGTALRMLRGSVSIWNPQIIWNGGLLQLGLEPVECGIAAFSLLLLLAVSLMQQKGSVRERIGHLKLPIRWIIWYALLFYVILFGYYGPGFSASEFIYQGF